ncbi:MAG: metallophosphoesterase, partial [Methylococcus sp.]
MRHRLGKPFNGKVAMTGCHGAIGGPWLAKKTQGRKDDVQRRVGRAIRQSEASLVFLLGDNFYDDGVKTARDERFVSAFRDVYIENQSKDRQVIFAILGNHDKIHNFSAHSQTPHKKALGFFQNRNFTVGRSPRETMERGYRQVAYTYENANKMQIGNLPHAFWNMPNSYYLLYSQLADFFCIDSNSYIFDTAQQAWLKQAFKDRSGVRNAKILVQHHPIVSAGQRIESHDDLKMYASAFGTGNFREQVPESSTKPIAGGDDVLEMGWNTGYRMDQDGLDFNLIFCAH